MTVRIGQRLEPLSALHWLEVYGLMRGREFPNVPATYGEALPYLARCRLYGVEGGNGLEVVFVVGPADDGVAFLDVVCARPVEGKWATRAVMGSLADVVFRELGLRCVWVQAHTRHGLKAALQAGFVPATELDGKAPVLVMTPLSLPAYAKASARQAYVRCAE
ncbi:MAG: hypothetical protein WAZ18_07250 [Alphaproteobacteria bacterium]